MPMFGIGFFAAGKSEIGDRKRLEDVTVGKFEKKDGFFLAAFDGHCGQGAALYAYDHLWNNIKTSEGFGSDKPEETMGAIKRGFAKTQADMLELFKKGDENINMSGTTVACAILRGRLLYIANVGDSGIILGKIDKTNEIIAEVVTGNHKPYFEEERKRVEELGGSVEVTKDGGELRVIYPSQRADDESLQPHKMLPKLNMTRSLGDLWSLIDQKGYLISPVPDVSLYHINPLIHKYVILATDGLLDVIQPKECVKLVHEMCGGNDVNMDKASKITNELIKKALAEWKRRELIADNISVVIGFITPNYCYELKDEVTTVSRQQSQQKQQQFQQQLQQCEEQFQQIRQQQQQLQQLLQLAFLFFLIAIYLQLK